ncbi:hypothetical protein PSECIP111951_02672 [Pseudoalteromonas holothuriae]|uniref:Integrase n=1 Tax=Pseudoalteromonas holothuriae TaxID=2963714 RepID=A0ABN8UMZ2_9GAMM|nr:integrase family protein [Pseudoalteromonas sp. CIP111951]CAH9062352.1 hypothetical protein PSECIP111951_02672 [Pseudoalteromonas sp. CIP111951]
MSENKFRFTESALDKLTPQKKRIRYSDTQLQGLVLDITPQGRRSFRVYKKIPGRTAPVSVTLGTYPSISLEAARKMARKAMADIAEGVNPNDTKRQFRAASVKLIEAYNAFLRARTLSPITVRGYNQVMGCYISDWQQKRLADITEAQVYKRHTEITQRSKAQADLTMRTLRAIFNFAKAEYKSSEGRTLFPFNPVNVLSEKRAWNNVKRKQTRLRQSQLKPFIEAINQVRNDAMKYRFESQVAICDYVEFVAFTGLRKTELLLLEWKDVYLEDKLFWIGKTKNQDGVELPITDRLEEIFERRKEYKVSEYVFGSNNKYGRVIEPKKTVAKINALSDVKFSLHDLRRTYISIAESLGVGNYTLKRLLNHRTSRDDVTGGYTILTAEELREPAIRVAKKLEECAGLRSPESNDDLENMKSLLVGLSKEQKLELMASLL